MKKLLLIFTFIKKQKLHSVYCTRVKFLLYNIFWRSDKMINIFFSKLNQNAIIPRKREEDAGYDIYPCFADEYLIINPDETAKIPTGIASCFPKEYCFIIM